MFTNYFIKKKILALAAQAVNRPHHSVSLNEARSILILYNGEDQDALIPLLEHLRKRLDIYTCVYIPSKTSDAIPDDKMIPVYSKNGLNAWGFPTETLLNKTSAIDVDILIDISRPKCYALQYIALKHPSTFKVGIKYQGQEWYDLALTMTDNNDIRYLFEQILSYLGSISVSGKSK